MEAPSVRPFLGFTSVQETPNTNDPDTLLHERVLAQVRPITGSTVHLQFVQL